ncbi:MAG: YraN family protein [Thermoleophilia bacterium]
MRRSLSLRRSPAQAGRDGERLAMVLYLVRGYRVVGRNVRVGRTQVDLVCRRGNQLVLVEVKLRRTMAHGGARQALGYDQARRLLRAGMWLRARYPWVSGMRVDLVAIDGWRVQIVRSAVDGDTYLSDSERVML